MFLKHVFHLVGHLFPSFIVVLLALLIPLGFLLKVFSNVLASLLDSIYMVLVFEVDALDGHELGHVYF